MTADERTIIEWALWNVRACDLPTDVEEACWRLVKSGDWPRPDRVGGYQPVTAHVSAFPKDETQPLRGRYASRPHVGNVVQDLATDDVAYILVTFGDH